MRKLDYLRKAAKKSGGDRMKLKIDGTLFRRHGDYDIPYPEFIMDSNGVCGVVIVHTELWEEDSEEPFFLAWREYFYFKKYSPSMWTY